MAKKPSAVSSLSMSPRQRKAKMRIARGKVLTFPIEILSKQDQKYVEEQGPIVQAKKALSIDTKHYSKRTEKNKPAQGQWHFEKYDHNYIVTVENNRDEMLKDVTVEYVFFVERIAASIKTRLRRSLARTRSISSSQMD